MTITDKNPFPYILEGGDNLQNIQWHVIYVTQ